MAISACILAVAAAGLLAVAGEPPAPPAAKSEASATRSDAPAAKSDASASAPAWLKAIPYRIVYETYRDTSWELVMASADGSHPVNLTNTPDIDEMYPHVSPDGSKISFVVNTGAGKAIRRSAWIMNLDGTGRTKVADDIREACWGGDSSALALTKDEFPTRHVHEDYASKGVALFDIASAKLTDHPNKDLEHLYNLCWSPDGRWFVATVHGGMGYDHTTLAIEAHGMKVVDLKIPGCRPDLSADGKHIAWGASDFELAIGDIDFTADQPAVRNIRTVVRSKEPMMVYHVDWSPDGKFLAFSRGPMLRRLGADPQVIEIKAKGWNIGVANVETGEWVEITTDGLCNKEPDWVPATAPAKAG
jgi:WD40 repeat protein